MIKYIIIGLGFMFLFEGLMYFILAKNLKNYFRLIENTSAEKIRNISIISCVFGASLIYFTIKFY
ncbi:MAG: hypothetical protein CFH19_00839 [Alphaproteobacteria bacterium MarineAlpha5_Bin9]|nr:MAG: hypothetical protein CFH19_00839 [Alphaproteobacteria bacterium MarineAlpha5_Bin9]|tara:strand:+ start:4763 stop:4957 length:195 start_codon:yes stop_codon:yes gene_type:complete